MHKTAPEAADYFRQLTKLVPQTDPIEVVLAPPFTALHIAVECRPHPFPIAAQNLHWEDTGPFTGEVSAPMLKALGCQYVILGHSERRQYFGDDDAGINKKVHAALRHGLQPILCVGESLTQREQGQSEQVATGQLSKCLHGVSGQAIKALAIAYEPIWAIGTGQPASPDQITAMHTTLRTTLSKHWDRETGDQVRILYGGSVTPENVVGFLSSNQVDGALVGGACLDPHTFATIINLALSLPQQG